MLHVIFLLLLLSLYNCVAGVGCTRSEYRYPPDSDFSNFPNMFSNWLVKPISKFSIIELKSLFIPCQLNMLGVIAFHALLCH